jgi:hypothetical protein
MSDYSKKEAPRQRLAATPPPRKKTVSETAKSPEPLPDHKHLPDYEDDSPHRQVTHILRDIVFDLRFQVTSGILILAILAALAAPPIYRRIKVWRAHQFMDQCEAIAKTGKFPKAMALLRQALLLAPADEKLFRRVRLFNAGIGDPLSLNVLLNLMVEGQASLDEILVIAEQSLVQRKTAITKEALQKLSAHPSARRSIIEMRLTAMEGNPQAAVDLARASLKNFPPDEGEQILIATADLVLRTNPEISQEILSPISKKSTANGLAALRMLAHQQLTVTGKNSIESSALAKGLTSHPLHINNDLLLAAEVEILNNPSTKPTLLNELTSRFSTLKEEDQFNFVRWLTRRQYHQEAIDFVGRDRALANPEWLFLYLDAMAGLDRWNDIFSLLDANSVVGLSDGIRLLFLARASEKCGDQPKANQSWREMQAALQYEKPEVVSFVAAYTQRIGEHAEARKAYNILAQRRESALEGYLGIIRCTPKNAPAAELIPVYNELLEVFPNLQEARSDLAYLQLLTDQNITDASFFANESLKRSPNSLAAMSVYALAQLKNGTPDLADEIYTGKPIAWSTAPDNWKNIRAAVLYAAGKKTEADEIAALIDKNQLRPEELALLPTH